jgi:energy-coupling factor transporter ATP-binding protein EcfA2
VELIDKDFIDQLNYNAQIDCNSTDKNNISKTNIFRFYSGSSSQNEQWFGVLNELDYQRDCLPLINKQVEELFKKDSLDCKVGALVYGEGGCGKSTLLRRIAIDILIKNKRYINWWVEDIDVFMDYESSCISDNPDQKHIVFIDDWYRNKPEDKGRRFFRWVKQQFNVLVLIGDRKNNGTYMQHLYGNKAFNLKPSENIKILEHISGRSPDLKKFVNKLQDEKKLLENISIFILLFVISHLYENEKKEGGFDLKDGVQSKFQRIVAEKLLDLENDDRYQGLGKALYLIAEIYAHPSLNYFSFSEESFLKIASFLGNNTELPDRIHINGFPEQVKSLLHTKIATAKNVVEYKKIYFNHDVLAEEGVIYANNIYSELKLELELFDLQKLFEYLAEQCDLTGSLMLWLWLYTIKLKNNTGGDELLAIIRKDLNLIPSSLLVYMIKNKVTSEFKKKICKYILEQDAFFKLPQPIVSTALNILQNEETGKTAAKTILEQKEFFKLPQPIVSTALGKPQLKLFLNKKRFSNCHLKLYQRH